MGRTLRLGKQPSLKAPGFGTLATVCQGPGIRELGKTGHEQSLLLKWSESTCPGVGKLKKQVWDQSTAKFESTGCGTVATVSQCLGIEELSKLVNDRLLQKWPKSKGSGVGKMAKTGPEIRVCKIAQNIKDWVYGHALATLSQGLDIGELANLVNNRLLRKWPKIEGPGWQVLAISPINGKFKMWSYRQHCKLQANSFSMHHPQYWLFNGTLYRTCIHYVHTHVHTFVCTVLYNTWLLSTFINCPQHIMLHSINKFCSVYLLVGLIARIANPVVEKCWPNALLYCCF